MAERVSEDELARLQAAALDCPLCGHRPNLLDWHEVSHRPHVFCFNGHVVETRGRSLEEAVEKWNARPPAALEESK